MKLLSQLIDDLQAALRAGGDCRVGIQVCAHGITIHGRSAENTIYDLPNTDYVGFRPFGDGHVLAIGINPGDEFAVEYEDGILNAM